MKKEDDRRKRTYLDKKVTPEEVQKIVDAAIAKALATQEPDYPPTRAEIQTMTAPENINAKPETYLQKAKRLGVATHIPTGGMRKKAEIVADIEAKEVKKEIKAGQSVPGEDDEYARGLTEKDMI
jgi:molybdopterin-biosynthesis enzyme MoeA-like protein